MVVDLNKRYESTCKFVKKNNMKKLSLDILNLAFSIEVQILVSSHKNELITELTQQYVQLEKKILNETGVNIA